MHKEQTEETCMLTVSAFTCPRQLRLPARGEKVSAARAARSGSRGAYIIQRHQHCDVTVRWRHAHCCQPGQILNVKVTMFFLTPKCVSFDVKFMFLFMSKYVLDVSVCFSWCQNRLFLVSKYVSFDVKVVCSWCQTMFFLMSKYALLDANMCFSRRRSIRSSWCQSMFFLMSKYVSLHVKVDFKVNRSSSGVNVLTWFSCWNKLQWHHQLPVTLSLGDSGWAVGGTLTSNK